MTEESKEQLYVFLNEYYMDKSKTCNYDCYNCELGILESYGSMNSCAVEKIMKHLEIEYWEQRSRSQT